MLKPIEIANATKTSVPKPPSIVIDGDIILTVIIIATKLIKAFISPSVMKFTGIVKNLITGITVQFNNVSIATNITAASQSEILKLGINQDKKLKTAILTTRYPNIRNILLSILHMLHN